MKFTRSDLILLLSTFGVLFAINLLEQRIEEMQRLAAETFEMRPVLFAVAASELAGAVLLLALAWYAVTRDRVHWLVSVLMALIGLGIWFYPLLGVLMGSNLLPITRFLFYPGTTYSLAAAFVLALGLFALIFRRKERSET